MRVDVLSVAGSPKMRQIALTALSRQEVLASDVALFRDLCLLRRESSLEERHPGMGEWAAHYSFALCDVPYEGWIWFDENLKLVAVEEVRPKARDTFIREGRISVVGSGIEGIEVTGF